MFYCLCDSLFLIFVLSKNVIPKILLLFLLGSRSTNISGSEILFGDV